MRNSDPTAPHPQTDDSASRFFIGGIQRHITKDDLEKYFGGFGEVSSIILKYDHSGNPRGFGWLTYRSQAPGLVRPDPHMLKGVKLTVEQALSQGPRSLQKRHEPGHSNYNRRRMRSSRSPSGSRSSSSSSSSSLRPRIAYHRNSSGNGKNRLPTISSNSRLPRLSTTNSNVTPSAQTAPPPPPPPPPPMYNPASAAVGTTRPSASATSQETYVCIPFALCPSEFLTDPRVFCARLDQSRIGSLQIVQSPFVSASAPIAPSTTLVSAGALQGMLSAMSR